MANGNAYFYNLSEEPVTLNVNTFNGDKIAGLGSAPYTPNASASSPYQRYDTAAPQQGQLGSENQIEYNVSGGAGGKVNVNINVDFGKYPEDVDLIIYLFDSAVVVLSPMDSTPYLGENGSTIFVGAGSPQAV
jgi:hypothetical protein